MQAGKHPRHKQNHCLHKQQRYHHKEQHCRHKQRQTDLVLEDEAVLARADRIQDAPARAGYS
eukprot:3055678-Rhodomonas_salina.2